MSRQDEEEFYEALTKFWSSQGSGGKRILAKYQPFESMRLTSGMPTFGAHHFWTAVMAIGGHALVSFCLKLNSSSCGLMAATELVLVIVGSWGREDLLQLFQKANILRNVMQLLANPVCVDAMHLVCKETACRTVMVYLPSSMLTLYIDISS